MHASDRHILPSHKKRTAAILYEISSAISKNVAIFIYWTFDMIHDKKQLWLKRHILSGAVDDLGQVRLRRWTSSVDFLYDDFGARIMYLRYGEV